MVRLTPIGIDGDSGKINDALCRLLVREAILAKKRPCPLDIMISSASIKIIVALEDYMHGDKDADETVSVLDKVF